MSRHAFAVRATVLALVLLGGCASSSRPHWYVLPVLPPASATGAPAAEDGQVWALDGVTLSAALDRDRLLLASGLAGLQTLSDLRWAEPMRESVPRVLLRDLAALRGSASVWAAPLPQGVQARRRLQVHLQVLQAEAGGRRVHLQATWWMQDTPVEGTAARAPRIGEADIEVEVEPSAGTDPADSLAAAHRLALWRLAQQITAGAAPPRAAQPPSG